MTSSVWHVRQPLTFDIFKVPLYGHAVDVVLVNLVNVRDECLASHNHGLFENSDLRLPCV